MMGTFLKWVRKGVSRLTELSACTTQVCDTSRLLDREERYCGTALLWLDVGCTVTLPHRAPFLYVNRGS